MKVTVIPIVTNAHGNDLQRSSKMTEGGRNWRTSRYHPNCWSATILRSLLEIWEDFLPLKFQWKLSSNAGGKNVREVNTLRKLSINLSIVNYKKKVYHIFMQYWKTEWLKIYKISYSHKTHHERHGQVESWISSGRTNVFRGENSKRHLSWRLTFDITISYRKKMSLNYILTKHIGD